MIVLVLGGARSGKSAVAEAMATRHAGAARVSVLATAVVADDDMAARVAAHRARRPASWITVETGADLVGALRSTAGVALVDSLGTWVAGLGGPSAMTGPAGHSVGAAALCAALTERPGDTVVVSEEVGMGVHPSTEVGRRFRDALGEVNQAVAAVADEVVLVVAGRTLHLGAVAASGPPGPAVDGGGGA